jgi:chromosome segregation ATPase
MPPTESETPETPIEGIDANEAVETTSTEGTETKPGLLDQAGAIFSDRAKLLAENRKLRADLGIARATETQMRGELAELTEELNELREAYVGLETEREGLKAAIAAAEADQRTVETAVVDELAAIGVPSANLPSSAAEPVLTPAEAALDKFRTAITPDEKAAAYAELKAAEAAAARQAG